MNNLAGIDVSKGKSMVSVLRPFGEVVALPFTVQHTPSELRELANYLKSLEGETRVVMEHTGRYYEPIAQALHDAGIYPVVMSMYGVGERLGPQLIAEIGDVTRFAHKGSLSAFAGVDPGANQSGNMELKSVRSSKCGSPALRKALFNVMDCLIKKQPMDDPVYLFMDKKRAEGKPYFVYMTAGANKFLRVYYGRVTEYLKSLDTTQ